MKIMTDQDAVDLSNAVRDLEEVLAVMKDDNSLFSKILSAKWSIKVVVRHLETLPSQKTSRREG